MTSLRITSLHLFVVMFFLVAVPSLGIRTAIAVQEASDAAAYNAKGLELSRAGNYSEAVKSYKQAIKLSKDFTEAHFNLGTAYFQLAQYKQAIDSYKQALKYQPNFPLAYNNMGMAHFKLGEHTKAIAAYHEAIRLDPKSGSAYYNLAATYVARGKEKDALEQYQILKGIDADLAHQLYLLIYKPMAGVFGATSGVRLNVIATDSNGSLMDNLTQNDFQVFEDDVPQTITSFSKAKYPLVYGLTVDTSGSMRYALAQAVQISKSLIENNGPGDATLLIRFISSDKIETVQEFSADKKVLNDALDTLYVEGGQSAIIDAVYLSAQRVAQYAPENSAYLRRAVILITDGDERVSYYNLKALVTLLRKIDVQIFVICLNQESFGSSHLNQNLVKGATPLLTTLANETGGQVFFPKSVSELSTVIKQVTALSRTQYLIGYKPARPAEPSVYRRVSVKPLDQVERDKITVVVRTGYTVAEPRPAP